MVGVNVKSKVPATDVSIVAGLQTPLTELFDTVERTAGVAPTQYGP